MHRGTAQLLVGGLLAGGHLHQRRAAEEYLGPLVDHDHVVAHARDVGAPSRGVSEHHGHSRDGGGRVPREITECLAPGDEQLSLGRQVRPSGLGQADRGETVGQSDVRASGPLAEGPGVHGPAPDRWVGGVDQALDALDDTNAHDGGGPNGVLGAPGGEGAKFDKRRVPIEEQLYPLACGQLSPLPVTGDVALASAGTCHGQLGVDQVEALEEGALVLLEGVRVRVDCRGQHGHVVCCP